MALSNGPVVIANGATESAAFSGHAGGAGRLRFLTPAAFTGVAITFLGSFDGTNFKSVRKADGTAATVTVAADRIYPVPDECIGIPYLKLVSGSAEAAERTIQIIETRAN